MRTHQVLVLVACLSVAARQIDAVVNSGANTKDSISASTETNSEINKEPIAEVTDSTPTETKQEADKREAVIDLTGIFSNPVNTYLPTGGIDTGLPVPVYGVPNVGPNVVYPAPPPDVPPPLPAQYGVPNPPPKFTYGIPKYKPPRIKYGPSLFRPHHPKPIYGPPRKPYFPKPVYGPPKPHYGPPKPQFPKVPSKPLYIPTLPEPPILNPPPVTYGPPNIHPVKQYGPPEPVVHGPPPGVPAPPTPPDIKYDGWQPIPGLVSKPPQDTYGPPKDTYGPPKDTYGPPKDIYGPPKDIYGPPKDIYGPPQNTYGPPKDTYGPPKDTYGPPQNTYGPPKDTYGVPKDTYGPPQNNYGLHLSPNDLSINADFTPPQEGTVGIDSLGLQENYKSGGVVSDSYGAPLNTVTGSGGVVQISGEAHHQQSHQNHQSHQQNYQHNHQESYQQSHQSHQNHQEGIQNHQQDLSVIGLGGDNALSLVKSVGYELQGFDSYSSPSAGSYSAEGSYPPAKGYKYTQTNDYSNVNAAFGTQHFSKDIGLIPPSGVYGTTPNSQYGTPLFQPTNNFKPLPKRPIVFRDSIQTGYISPPAPDVKPVTEEINEPTNLYSLPHVDRPISFQNLVHGSSTAGLSSEINLNVLDSHQGAYALPLQSNGYDFNTIGYSNSGYQHDCNSHGSQPLPPQFTYGVPTNDLSGSHSVKVASSNTISEAAQEVYAKSFAGSIASGGELVQSQSLDLNNIPLQGALGSYTLQIQSADALGAASPSASEIPHEQILNEGLIQSILTAIEEKSHHNVPIEVNSRSDEDSEASVKSAVVVLPEESKDGKGSGEKVDDNQVAIYLKSDESDAKKSGSESYVSVKTSDASYKYDVKMTKDEPTVE